MSRTLYVLRQGRPSRAVLMLVKELGIEDMTLKDVDVFAGEHKQDWFLKINPKHCVPTLDDDGFILRESRTIMRYLCDVSPGGDRLYPKDLRQRLLVDQELDMGAGFYSKAVGGFMHAQLFMRKDPSPEEGNQVRTQLTDLDVLLEGKGYLANNTYSIADLSMLADLTMLELVDFDFSIYKNVVAWMELLKTRQCYSVNEEGLQIWRDMMTSPKLRAFQDNMIKASKSH